jgi:hypothetical protein
MLMVTCHSILQLFVTPAVVKMLLEANPQAVVSKNGNKNYCCRFYHNRKTFLLLRRFSLMYSTRLKKKNIFEYKVKRVYVENLLDMEKKNI